jgi:nucleotide-binding universal stress UspA family protein
LSTIEEVTMQSEARAKGTIVVGIDGTERGEDALALARLVAARDAHILLVAVANWESLEAERWLCQAAAKHPGASLETRTVAAGSPARGLREVAQATGAELIVVGSTHRSWLGRILPGSVGEHLLRDSPCAVGIAPRGFALSPQVHLQTLAVAYDTSPESEAAVRFAADLAEPHGAALRVLTPLDAHLAGHPSPVAVGAYLEIARSKHERLQIALDDLDQLLGSLPRGLRVENSLIDGDPARRLLEETESGIDLMVMGSRGYGAAARALMGSVLGTVIRSASCAIITVRPREAIAGEPAKETAELSDSAS